MIPRPCFPPPFQPCHWLLLAALVIFLDQLTKYWVLESLAFGETIPFTPFWNWVLVYNPGAAFSFLSEQSGWQRWFFSGFAVVVSFWIYTVLRRESHKVWQSLALALIMGGALGNVIDRLRFGAVVDFVQWHLNQHAFPAFNVADAAISVGAVLLILFGFIEKK